MKKFLNFLIFVSLLYLISCSEDSPLSYIDGYKIHLTEEKGTVYIGNYFPLIENYTCYYSGSSVIYSETHIPGEEPQSGTTSGYLGGMMKVLPRRNIHLNSGTFLLYPVAELTEGDNEITADTSRFFMKDENAVYVKAIKLSDGHYLEVDNPVYIKATMTVGDSWDTAPQLNMTELLTDEFSSIGMQSDLKLDAQSRFFVVGHEMIDLPVGMHRAMRLEQANDISLNGTLTMLGTVFDMSLNAQLSVEYHMIADTGIVHQNVTGSMNMQLTYQGETATFRMDIQQSELKLTDTGFDFSESVNIVKNETDHFEKTKLISEMKMKQIIKAFKRICGKSLML